MNNNETSLGKNYWIAMILSMVILLGYPILMKRFAPAKEKPETQAVMEVASEAESGKVLESSPALKPAEGPFIQKPELPTFISFTNQFYEINFSTMGGTISRLVYIGEKSLSGVSETPFFNGSEIEPGILGVKLLYEQTDISKVPFKLSRKDDSQGIFEFTYEKPGEYQLVKKFEFKNDEPVILLDVTYQNLSAAEKTVPMQLDYELHYEIDKPKDEQGIDAVAQTEKLLAANFNKVKKKGFFISDGAQWAGLLKKHYAFLIRPNGHLVNVEAVAKGEYLVGSIKIEPMVVAPAKGETKQFVIYAGPQRYEMLKKFDLGFENILSRGFFGIFKIWLLLALKFFYRFTHNFGTSVLLLTLILKGLFTPLTHISFETMKKMQALQPKIKSIQERHKKEPEKMNKEMMELYRRNKVNPMFGCLPMLAQIPVFIAFYQMLGGAIELKGAPFIGWIHDLAEPDKLFSFHAALPFIGNSFNLLPLLYVASTVWQQKLTPQSGTSAEQAKIMAVYTPILFGIIFYNMPSGLVLYAFMNNALSIIHQIFVKRMVVVLHHEDRE